MIDWNRILNRPKNYLDAPVADTVPTAGALTDPYAGLSPQDKTFFQLFQSLLAPKPVTATAQPDFQSLIKALKEPVPTPQYGLGGALITDANPTGNRSSLTPEADWRRMFPR